MLELIIAAITVMSLFGLRRYSYDVAHPYFWTNFSFLLYAVSFWYLSIVGIEGARFVALAGIDLDFRLYLTVSALLVLISKVFIELLFRGHSLSFNSASKINISSIDLVLFRGIALVFFLVGFLYWVYVTLTLTGGAWNVFSNVGIFKHVIKDNGLSTVWFQFSYIGAQLWFLSYCLSGGKVSRKCFVLLVPAFLMMLTTGRLAQSFIFLLVPLFFLFFNREGAVPFRKVRGVGVVAVVLIVFMFFFRQLTSYEYIGKGDDFYSLVSGDGSSSYFIESLVGGGNLPDPQQLVLILYGIETGLLAWTYGITYTDWAFNLLSDEGVRSVGYRILDAYFPDKVGGPTPGAIGEALLNFGPFLPFFLLAVGAGFVVFYRKAKGSTGLLFKFVYIKALLHFWALYLKVDSSLLFGLLWQVLPITFVWWVFAGSSKKKCS